MNFHKNINNSIAFFNIDGLNSKHERASVADFIQDLMEKISGGVPITVAAGFRVPGAEVDLFVATRQRLIIGEMKNWKGRIYGRMNGPWSVLSKNKVTVISGESPYQQILRARSRVRTSLEKHAQEHQGRGGDIFKTDVDRHPKRIADVIDAGLVQCPKINAEIDVDEKWWFAVGLKDFAKQVADVASNEGPINIKSIESWLARLGCLRGPSLDEALHSLSGKKPNFLSEDLNELHSVPEEAETKKAEQVKCEHSAGLPQHRGLPSLPIANQELRNHAESFANLLASRSFKKNLLIRAGPGAGKTYLLAKRALRACESKLGTVVVISYTNAARDEVRRRFEAFLAKEHTTLSFNNSPFFGTIHQFSYWLLSDEKNQSSEKIHILDETVAESAFEDIIGIDIPYRDFVQHLNNNGELGLQYNSSYSNFFKKWIMFYDALNKRNEASFETIIAKACKAVQNKEILREIPGAILVDEYQDVTGLQDELFRALYARGVHLTVVGDREQSIFSFAGSNPSRFDRFQKDFAPSDVETVEANWRSVPMIANWGRILRTDDLNQFCINSEDPQFNPAIYIQRFDSARREADWIATEIERLASLATVDSILRYNDLAIIHRENATRAFEQALDRRGIPWQRLGVRTVTTKVMERLLAFIDCLAPDANESDLSRLVMSWPGSGPKVISQARSWSGELTDISLYFENSDTDKRILRVLQKLEFMRKQGREKFWDSVDIVKEVYKVVKSMLTAGEAAEISKHDGNVEPILLAATLHLSEWAAPPKTGWVFARDFTQNIRTNGFVQTDEEQDAVVISTIHAAKGGQWNVVFLPSLLNGIIPHRNSGNVHDEERRLLHVAITRAKRQCVLSWCPEIPGRGKGESKFLQELHSRV